MAIFGLFRALVGALKYDSMEDERLRFITVITKESVFDESSRRFKLNPIYCLVILVHQCSHSVIHLLRRRNISFQPWSNYVPQSGIARVGHVIIVGNPLHVRLSTNSDRVHVESILALDLLCAEK